MKNKILICSSTSSSATKSFKMSLNLIVKNLIWPTVPSYIYRKIQSWDYPWIDETWESTYAFIWATSDCSCRRLNGRFRRNGRSRFWRDGNAWNGCHGRLQWIGHDATTLDVKTAGSSNLLTVDGHDAGSNGKMIVDCILELFNQWITIITC